MNYGAETPSVVYPETAVVLRPRGSKTIRLFTEWLELRCGTKLVRNRCPNEVGNVDEITLWVSQAGERFERLLAEFRELTGEPPLDLDASLRWLVAWAGTWLDPC